MTPAPTVFVTDDELPLLEALRMMLEADGFAVATFPSPHAFLGAYTSDRAGCLVCDLHMPEMSGLQLIAELRARNHGLPVILMTGYGDVPTAVAAMQAGAMDFLEKPVSRAQLVPKVCAALEKDAQLREEAARKAEIETRLASLSQREREVLDFLREGVANKVIAARLGVSIKTAEKHRARLLHKMRARNVIELVNMLPAHPARHA